MNRARSHDKQNAYRHRQETCIHAIPMTMEDFVRGAAHTFEIAGIAAMLLGSLLAGGRFLRQRVYHALRKDIARSILVGLELLIAADIISTITVRPTLSSVLVLAVIVLIRTFLSFTLELEATGRFPWQRDATPVSAANGARDA